MLYYVGRRLTFHFVVVAAILIGSSSAIVGQATTATILGRVTDQSGAIIPEATVLVLHEGTGSQRITTTDARGRYEVSLLSSGAYRVEITALGFKSGIRTGVQLRVNERVPIDLTLEVGELSEQVVVLADAPLVQSETSTVGTVIDGEKLVDLPLNGRDFFQLTTLVTGALPPAEGSQNATQGGAVSISGAREQSNNFLLDGVDNNDLAINQIVMPPSVDAIQEFKIQSSSYAAEFGRSGGGQFNYVTKSGANTLHGSLYGFVRNAALDAKNFFDDPNRDIPQFQRSLFGGTVGGPFVRDQLFFFGHYEGGRIRKAVTRLATVPPIAWLNGDFSSLLTGVPNPTSGLDAGQIFDPRTGMPVPGNRIPAALIDPAGAAIAAQYPPPDDHSATGPSTATVAPLGRTDLNQFTIKIDQNTGSDDRLFYRYSLSDEDRFDPFDPLFNPTNVPGFGTVTLNRGQSLAVGWTRVLGARAVHDFRFGFNRLRNGIFQENQGNDIAGALGIRGLLTDPIAVGAPGVVVGITDALTEAANLPQERRSRTFQFVDSLTWLQGNHSVKVGIDLRHVRVPGFLDVFARGRFIFVGLSGNPIADLLMGTPLVALRQNPEQDSVNTIQTTALNWYVQDDWKLTNDLTLNLGVRYDYNQPATEAQDRFALPDLDNPEGGFLLVGEGGVPRAGYQADKNNFAPRLGFAWTPFGTPRTALRGGYGVFYDASLLNVNVPLRFNPPHFGLDLAFGPLDLRNAFEGGTAPVSIVNGLHQDYRDGYYQHWNVNLQHEVLPSLLVDVGYFASSGRHLPRRLDLNQGPPGGPPVRNPSFGPADVVVSSASSSYHSLQVRVERRLVDGLSFLSAYTWSRSRDHASGLFGSRASNGVPQNSFDPDADYGPSDFDTPHRYVLSYVWELPFGPNKRFLSQQGVARSILGGWQFAGIATFQSGRPFTVFYGAGANFSGTSNGANGGPGLDRPNQVGNPIVADPDPARWFDPSAFAPPNNTFGDVGRNTLRGDAFKNVDLAFYKNVSLGEAGRLQFRVEIFNALNTPFFFLPVADLTNANAGRVVQAGDARQIQLGLKWVF